MQNDQLGVVVQEEVGLEMEQEVVDIEVHAVQTTDITFEFKRLTLVWCDDSCMFIASCS